MKAKDLRSSILQLAISGKLVPQNPDDEPASVLLAKIRAEKAKLVKEGKIKKQKPLPPVTEDEKPFDIPDSWVWVRIDDICENIVDCPHSTPKYQNNDTGFYAIDTNCMNDSGKISGFRFVTADAYKERTTRLIPRNNDIVYSREGSIGLIAQLPDKKICLGQRVMLLRVSQITDLFF